MESIILGLLEKGVPYLIVSLVRPCLTTAIGYFFMRKLLPNRMNVYLVVVVSLAYAIWSVLRSPEHFGTNYHLFMNIFVNALTFSVLIFLFKGRFWKRFIVHWYIQIICVMSETIAFVPLFLYYDSRGHRGAWGELLAVMESSLILYIIYIAVVILLFYTLGNLSLKIWNRLIIGRFQPFYLLFVALPVGQLYSLARVVHPNMGDMFFGITFTLVGDIARSHNMLSMFGASVCLATTIVMFFYIISLDKRTAIEAELQETKRVMELEQSRYREIELQSEEVAKIRHDFNNQLASILQLVRVGEDSTAQEMIDALSMEIVETKKIIEAERGSYCNVPVINAVLMEKAQTCDRMEIELTVDLHLPPSLAVEQVHLCSILEHLLDNAIYASGLAKCPEERGIQLSSAVDGDYLFVKVSYRSNEPHRLVTPGPARGSRILSDLALRYGGDYRTEYKDGMCSAVVSLLAVGG